MASAAQGNHPPRCAQAPAEAYARPAGSGNRLPVLDSEAPKLPIHTAIAVPQYGTQGSVRHLAVLPIWRLSPLRTSPRPAQAAAECTTGYDSARNDARDGHLVLFG